MHDVPLGMGVRSAGARSGRRSRSAMGVCRLSAGSVRVTPRFVDACAAPRRGAPRLGCARAGRSRTRNPARERVGIARIGAICGSIPRVDRARRVPLISVRGGSSMAQGASVSEVPARQTIPVTNPATGARLAEYPVADREAVAAAVTRAREAQPRWAALGFAERGRILRKVRDRFVDEKDRICDVVSGETGKPRHDVITNELLFLCDAIGFWAKRAGKYLADEPARPHLLKNKRVYVSYTPYGVVGIIGPWNFPFNLTIGEAIPALMAGNAVVIKPSEVTPGSAALGAELAQAPRRAPR